MVKIGHLPAPIINGEWSNLRLSRARELDLGSGHTAYRHASLISLTLERKFFARITTVVNANFKVM